MSTAPSPAPAHYTIPLDGPADFDSWRTASRALVLADVPEDRVRFVVGGAETDGSLFDAGEATPLPDPDPEARFTVSKRFVEKAQAAIHHKDADRFVFLYRLLRRLAVEDHLIDIASDPDIQRLEAMVKAVRRDAHKMHAFVRFRKIGAPDDEVPAADSGDAAEDDGRYVAWFEPDHWIVEREAGFFIRRFNAMNWSILTPKGSIHWDRETLTVGPPAQRSDAPSDDATEELWRTYFTNIFNPARLKVKAMTAEMPKKYWRNLPEAALIPDLIAGAERRARTMIENAPTLPPPSHAAILSRHWKEDEPTMATQLPLDDQAAGSLPELRELAEGCTRCPLYQDATQTVFGEGPADARVVFVGEQPGDKEDIAGRPFIGPAGAMFDETLEEVGIDRSGVYVTNAVKHFKFKPRGKFRLHQKPDGGEVAACRWWLGQELELIAPDLAVALGATAGMSLLGREVRVMKERGRVHERDDGLRVFLTVHPSFLLRIPDERAKAAERDKFREDMIAVRELMAA